MELSFINNLAGVAPTESGSAKSKIRYTPTSTSTFLLVPIILLFALLIVAVVRSPNLLTSSGIGSAIIVVTPLMLATFALTSVVMAGRAGVDLSIGPLIGFINVTLVVLFERGVLESGVAFFVYAIAVGIIYQVIMGAVIYFVRIQPIIVALSGYLILAGLNLIILPRPGGSAPDWLLPWGLGTTIWSPVLLVLAAALAGWFLFTRTAFYDHLRLMGSDERTAYSAGVNIVAVRLGAHAMAGVFAGLSAITFTSLISSGDPTQGTTYTLLAVTALVLGGTSLGGGRGSIIGSMLGALNIYLITYVLATFNFGKVQSFVTELSYGTVLVLALLMTLLLPKLQQVTRGFSPLAVFIVLGLGVTAVALHVKDDVVAVSDATSSNFQSLGGQSGGTSLASQSGGGTSLAAQSGGGTSLAAQSGGGTSLAAQSGGGTSLASQSGGGTSLAAQSGGTSLAGQSLAGGAAAEEVSTRGTGVVIAVVIIAAAAGIAYLMYRFPGIPTFALAGVAALLLIGYTAHDFGATLPSPSERLHAAPFLYLEGPYDPVAWSASPLFDSTLASVAVVLLGAVLVGSVLIFTTVTFQSRRLSRPALNLIILTIAVIVGLMVYETGVFRSGTNSVFSGGVSALIVAAILFVPTLPNFQAHSGGITQLMLGLLGATALGAMLFAVGDAPATGPDTSSLLPTQPTLEAMPAPEFPEWFYIGSWSVLIIAVVIFLLAIPQVRRHIVRDIGLESTVRRISYLGLFIAGFAVLALGAVFVIGSVPIWKFAVALIAALIFSRILWNFLADYKRRQDASSRGESI